MHFGILSCMFLSQSLNILRNIVKPPLQATLDISQETLRGLNSSKRSSLLIEELHVGQNHAIGVVPTRLKLINATSASAGHLAPCSCANCLDDKLGKEPSRFIEEKKDTKRFRSFISLASTDVSHDSEHVRQILEHNQQWVKETNERDPEFFFKLAQPQRPKYLYYGCSDSRVPANQILGLGPGEVFVHRNIGNQVMGNDLNALSVLEYGVMYLGVTDIIVTGHYDCGAVRAATKRQDLGTLEHWLRSIRDVYRLHRAELDDLETDEDKHFALVELNVIEQCLNLFKTGVVQRKRIQARKALLESGKLESELGDDVYPRIHGFVFNPADGVLKKLPIDFEKSIGSLDRIYGLYDGSFAM